MLKVVPDFESSAEQARSSRMLDGERKANWKGGEAEGRHGHTGQGTAARAHHQQTAETPYLKERELFSVI